MSGKWAGGKGDNYRPVNQKKYEENYLRCFGAKCPKCKGDGGHLGVWEYGYRSQWYTCSQCGGVGYVERRKVEG